MVLRIIKSKNGLAMLNLGCGDHFHPEWTNVDINSTSALVQPFDLRRPLPFENDSFDAIYTSHVLEHFDRAEGERFLWECYRVCKEQGVIRVVIPDLEMIARMYLSCLEKATLGLEDSESFYDWMMLELYDQVVRSTSGGEMVSYIQSASSRELKFIEGRVGKSLTIQQSLRSRNLITPLSRILRLGPLDIWQRLKILIMRFMTLTICGRDGVRILDEVLFRSSGEVHRWMYDRYSLQRSLQHIGFSQIRVCSPHESRIHNWDSFRLDIGASGEVLKPDSLYCEAVK